MQSILVSDSEFLLERIEDDGQILRCLILPTRLVKNVVLPDDQSKAIEICFESPCTYIVMDELLAAANGFKAEKKGDVLFESERAKFMKFFGMTEIYSAYELKFFLLVTAHTVICVVSENAPMVSEKPFKK